MQEHAYITGRPTDAVQSDVSDTISPDICLKLNRFVVGTLATQADTSPRPAPRVNVSTNQNSVTRSFHWIGSRVGSATDGDIAATGRNRSRTRHINATVSAVVTV
jgi:hypothetical protein